MREFELKGRKYWIMSDPHEGKWKASVVELIDSEGQFTEPTASKPSARRAKRQM